MRREDARIGQQVRFGRENGEKTLGKIIKVNFKTAKVETLENRGRTKSGEKWSVGYSLLEPVESNLVVTVIQKDSLADKAIITNALTPSEDVFILDAIRCIYEKLSPETLTCDGLATKEYIRKRAEELHFKLKALFIAYGREVSEDAIHKWKDKLLSE